MKKIGCKWMLSRLVPLLCALVWGVCMASAQTQRISGQIHDSESGEPVVGATIIVVGTQTGTVTDAQGAYELTADLNAKLSVSCVGYQPQTLDVKSRTRINVSLKPDTKAIDEVVVVGYGVVKKRDLTGSVATVKSEAITQTATSTLSGALIGKVAGLQISSVDGGPGDGTQVIRIRGGNSINGSNDPLWVVDGFISAGGASSVPAEDIKSIEVLKDASATAIYGARGANGVIIVTTKRGEAGGTTVNFKSSVGAQWVSRSLPLMDARQTYDYWNAFDKNYLDARVDPSKNYDWVDAITRVGIKQNYFASVSGGRKGMTYNVSAEYNANQGVIKYNSDATRLTLRGAFDFELCRRIKAGVTIRYRHSVENTLGNGSFYQMIVGMSPLVAAFNPDGSYNMHLNPGNLDSAIGVDLYGSVKGNPIQYIREAEAPETGKLLNLQGYVNYEPIKGLVFRSEASYMQNNKWSASYMPSTIDVTTPAKLQHAEGISYEVVNTLTYMKDFGRHRLNAMVGQTIQADKNQSLAGGNKYFAADGFTWNNLGAGNPVELKDITAKSSYSGSTILSFIARVNYSFDDKYLFTVSGRADGASKFSKNHKWGYFPAAAFSWRASEEEFIKNLNVFDNLKFRTSIGVTGSEAIKPYQTLGLMSSSQIMIGSSVDAPYGTLSKIFVSDDLANDNLSWETTVQYDLGVDMGFFKNRLTASFDFYNKDTRDLLFSVPMNPESGYDVKLSNVGKINNRGVELTLEAVPVVGKHFSWATNFNIAHNRNRVVSLGGSQKIDQSPGDMPETIYLEVGRPVGAIYAYVTDGVWQTTEEIENYPHRSSDKPGDFRIVDTNRDGYIDSKDKVRVGDPNPKFTFGWGNTLTYRNLELSFFFAGSYGNDVINFNKHKLMVDSGRHADLVNYWTAENGSQTHASAGNSNVPKMIDKYIEDGSFIKLKNISLVYNLPEKFLKKLRMKRVSIFVTGTDLWTITGYSGINPEANQAGNSNTLLGIDYSTYPLSASLVGGLNFTF